MLLLLLWLDLWDIARPDLDPDLWIDLWDALSDLFAKRWSDFFAFSAKLGAVKNEELYL